MSRSVDTFVRLLRDGVDRVAFCQSTGVMQVREEIARAMGRKSGGTLEYWSKGHLPRKADIEQLAREMIARSDLDIVWLDQFLASAGYPARERAAFCQTLFPTVPDEADTEAALPNKSRGAEQQAHIASPPGLSHFVTGPPITHVRQFFGRQEELAFVFSALQRFPLENIAVIGAPRSGKTSLLYHLMQITAASPEDLRPGQRNDWLPQPNSYQWAFVDFQDVRMHTQDRLLQHLLRQLNIPAPESCDLSHFMDAVSDHLRSPTVILMDEIGAALAAPTLDPVLWWGLRSLGTTQTQGKLAFIYAAHAPPDRQAEFYGKPSPFFNIFLRLDLGPLTEPEARELISSAPISFDTADIDWILQESQCWPAPLQLLCRVRLHALQMGKADDSWKQEGLRQIALWRVRATRTSPD